MFPKSTRENLVKNNKGHINKYYVNLIGYFNSLKPFYFLYQSSKIVYCLLISYNKPIEIDVNWDWNSFISSQNLTSNHNINLNHYVALPLLDALMFNLTKFQPHNKIKKGIKLFYYYIYLELSLWYNCYIKGRLEITGRKWKNISLI